MTKKSLNLQEQFRTCFQRTALPRERLARRPGGQVPELPNSGTAVTVSTPGSGVVGELLGESDLFLTIFNLGKKGFLSGKLVRVVIFEQARTGQELQGVSTILRDVRCWSLQPMSGLPDVSAADVFRPSSHLKQAEQPDRDLHPQTLSAVAGRYLSASGPSPDRRREWIEAAPGHGEHRSTGPARETRPSSIYDLK